MQIPKIYSFTTDFLIVKGSDSLETVKTLILRINPKYLVISKEKDNKKYRYTVLKDAFMDGINECHPSENEPLEKNLDLNENNSYTLLMMMIMIKILYNQKLEAIL